MPDLDEVAQLHALNLAKGKDQKNSFFEAHATDEVSSTAHHQIPKRADRNPTPRF